MKTKHILWFRETGIRDMPTCRREKCVARRNVSKSQERKASKVPNGFSVTAEAYRYFMHQNDLDG